MVQRVGLIIPSSNRMVEEEMVRFYPQGVVAHVTRLRMTGPNRRPLAELLPRIEEAAASLADAKCDVISFHCTVTSMSDGPAGETAILDALKRAGAKRFATTSTAVRAALNALKVKRLALVTPYDAHKTEEEIEFLHAAGYDIVSSKGYNLTDSDAYCSTPAATWRERVLEAKNANADAYFLSCANIQALSIIGDLEQTLNRPVLTSNQVVIWDALQQINWQGANNLPSRLFNL